MNICIWVFEWACFHFSLMLHLGMELLDCIVTPCLTSGGNVFPKQPHHCIFHYLYVRVAISQTPYQHLLPFILAILVISHCGFDFPNDYWCRVTFKMLIGLLHIFFGVAVCDMCVCAYTHMHIHADSHALIAEVVVHDNTCCFTYEVPWERVFLSSQHLEKRYCS